MKEDAASNALSSNQSMPMGPGLRVDRTFECRHALSVLLESRQERTTNKKFKKENLFSLCFLSLIFIFIFFLSFFCSLFF